MWVAPEPYIALPCLPRSGHVPGYLLGSKMVYTVSVDYFFVTTYRLKQPKLEKEIQHQTDEPVLFYNKGL